MKTLKSARKNTSGWKSRIVGHGTADPRSIVVNPKNYKAHPENQRDALKSAVAKLGFLRSVTINKRTGTLIDGHLRVALAIQEQAAAVDVEYVDLSEREELHALATMDPIAGLAEIDDDALDAMLTELGEAVQEIPEPETQPRRVGFSARDSFDVIVECANEGQQRKVMMKLLKDGFNCRPKN